MIYRFLDIETYCNLDLIKVGSKNYINHPSFEINIIGWMDVHEDDIKLPMNTLLKRFRQMDYLDYQKDFFKQGFNNENIILVAHNAAFEVAAFEKFLNISIDLRRVICTMVMSYQTGLPGGLEKISNILKLNFGKIPNKALMRYFASPCTPTRVNKGRTRNYPNDNPEKWENYKNYNKHDVLATLELFKILINFPQPELEKELWRLDRKINSKGIRIDKKLVHNAATYVLKNEKNAKEKLEELTGLENPNSNKQMREWFIDNCPETAITSIDKEHLNDLLTLCFDPLVHKVVKLKQLLGKTSTKKYNALEKLLHKDRLYDSLAFTATGTGRWAGRGFQIHNLPKNKIKTLQGASKKPGKEILHQIRESYKNGTRPITDDMIFELSQLLRTVIIPDDNKILLISDYSAIEARIAAWVADETWVLEVFKGDGKIYEAMASKMFGKEVNKVTKDERQDGKVAVLACGYGGGQHAISHFAKDWEEDKRQLIVDYYRDSCPKIVNIWKRLEKAAIYTIKNKVTTRVNNITFKFKKGCLLIQLPSGRNLTYIRAQVKKEKAMNGITTTEYWYDNIYYESLAVNKAWTLITTFGGKLFENIVQAIARDILAYALLTLDKKGHDIIMHVHDEVVTQVDSNSDVTLELDLLKSRMCRLPDWAEGLPLTAEGFATDYYMKEEEE